MNNPYYMQEKTCTTMNALKVPFLAHLNKDSGLDDIANVLDGLEAHPVAIAPWPEFSGGADVSFKIAHSGDCLFLKYIVTEPEIRIVYQQSNDPVYKDSCVEFFILMGVEKEYYNFEFNAIGTCLAAFGEDRNSRTFLPAATIAQIQSTTLLQTEHSDGQQMVSWTLTLKMPLAIFIHHPVGNLKNLQCRGNFYKCGDNLTRPHYLAWNAITAPQPDFHLSAFFGSIHFE